MIEYQPMAARKPTNQLDEIVSFWISDYCSRKAPPVRFVVRPNLRAGEGIRAGVYVLADFNSVSDYYLLDGRFIAPASKGCKQTLAQAHQRLDCEMENAGLDRKSHKWFPC